MRRPFPTRAAEPPGPAFGSGRALQVAEDIIPIAELKAHLSEVVRELDARGRPIVITLNGKPAAVLMAPRAYDAFAYHARVARKIERGLQDGAAERAISDDELGRRMDRRYGAAVRKKR